MAEHEPPAYLVEQVRDALAHDSRVGELGIKVRIVEHKVFVTGTVSTEQRREGITAVIHEILPGHEILNEVSVAMASATPGRETLE
jgi:osmotically-inducible protein OsmY